jgi:hypothetical protein
VGPGRLRRLLKRLERGRFKRPEPDSERAEQLHVYERELLELKKCEAQTKRKKNRDYRRELPTERVAHPVESPEGCNSHARRKFLETGDEGARQVIALYEEVFAVEREAAELGLAGTPTHLEVRQARSRPAMAAITAWCDLHLDEPTPKSPLGAAIRYVRNQWEPLTYFLDDAEVVLHNNLSERRCRARRPCLTAPTAPRSTGRQALAGRR